MGKRRDQETAMLTAEVEILKAEVNQLKVKVAGLRASIPFAPSVYPSGGTAPWTGWPPYGYPITWS